MISKDEVKHIAKLARLELTEGEIEKMQKDMSAILDYFNLLKKAPKSSGSLVAEKEGLKMARRDELRSPGKSTPEKLIALAPDKKDTYIKVKTIL